MTGEGADGVLSHLLDRRAELGERVAALQEQLDAVNAAIMGMIGVGTRTVGTTRVTVVETVRLDARKVATRYPAADYPAFYKAAPDTAAIRFHVAAEQLAEVSNMSRSLRVTET